MFGSGYGYSGNGYANDAEKNYQKQYDYYKNGNSKAKYKHDSTGADCSWWPRSVTARSTSAFCSLGASISSPSAATFSLGFAPGFKVA